MTRKLLQIDPDRIAVAARRAMARRVLVGEISEEDAMREIRQAFHQA